MSAAIMSARRGLRVREDIGSGGRGSEVVKWSLFFSQRGRVELKWDRGGLAARCLLERRSVTMPYNSPGGVPRQTSISQEGLLAGLHGKTRSCADFKACEEMEPPAMRGSR